MELRASRAQHELDVESALELERSDLSTGVPSVNAARSTVQVKQATGFYPRIRVDAAGSETVSHAGAVVLVETVRRLGVDRELSAALAR